MAKRTKEQLAVEAKRLREFRALHPEKVKEYEKRRRERHHEALLAYSRAHKEANRQRAQKWREENRERSRANTRNYEKKRRAENPEKSRQINRDNYARHAEQRRAYRSEYIAKYPERVATTIRNKRAMRQKATGRHTDKDIRSLFEIQHGKCAACKEKLAKYHVDHVMPLTLGGSNEPDNLQLLCPPCNRKKHAMHPDDWAKLNGKLFC